MVPVKYLLASLDDDVVVETEEVVIWRSEVVGHMCHEILVHV